MDTQKQNELALRDLAYRIRLYAKNKGITTDQALEEIRDKLEVKNE